MCSASFTFVLYVVGTTSCLAISIQQSRSFKASTEAMWNSLGSVTSGNYFGDVTLDEAMWDALTEAVLAICVFGAASALMQSYRKRNSKSIKPKLVKTSCMPLVAMKKAAAPWRAQHHSTAVDTGSPPKAAAPKPRSKPSEADLLAGAVRAGKASELPCLLDAALARSMAGLEQPDLEEELATSLLHSALRACAAARRFNEAIAAYEHLASRIGNASSGIWSVLLYVIVEAGCFDHHKHVFAKLCGLTTPSGHDFVNVVRCFAAQSDCKGLRSVLASMCSSNQSVDVYSLNRALAACSSSDCALDLAEELVAARVCSEGVDAVGYNTLMKYNARASRLSRCLELKSEMLGKGLIPSEITFGILLEACVSAKELESAREIFDDLCSSGLQLNVVHCTTFIKGLLSASKLDEAAAVLKEMSGSSRVKPDLIAYSTIVKAYAEKGDVAAALRMLEHMIGEGVKPDELICNNVLSGCCCSPLKSSQVMHTFETLIRIGLKPSTTTLSILLKGLALTEAWSTSLQLLEEAPTRFCLEPEMRLYAQLAQTCAKSRTSRVVLEVFDALVSTAKRRREKVDPAVAGRFLRSCLVANDIKVAVELHDMMQQAGVAVEAQVEKMLKTALTW